MQRRMELENTQRVLKLLLNINWLWGTELRSTTHFLYECENMTFVCTRRHQWHTEIHETWEYLLCSHHSCDFYSFYSVRTIFSIATRDESGKVFIHCVDDAVNIHLVLMQFESKYFPKNWCTYFVLWCDDRIFSQSQENEISHMSSLQDARVH